MYLYEFKMDLFDNGDLEEFLLLMQNFKMMLKALEMLADITKIQYLCTILCGKAPHQFDNFCAHVGGITSMHFRHIILGLGTYFPPVTPFTNKKSAMLRGMRRPHEIIARRYTARLIDIDEYLSALTGSKERDNIGNIDLNEIL